MPEFFLRDVLVLISFLRKSIAKLESLVLLIVWGWGVGGPVGGGGGVVGVGEVGGGGQFERTTPRNIFFHSTVYSTVHVLYIDTGFRR